MCFPSTRAGGKKHPTKSKTETEPSAELLLFSRIMYQDYCGNYDTSSRGSSSTSPAQPESFTSGSSTIGSPISTSGYQVPQAPTPTQTPLVHDEPCACSDDQLGEQKRTLAGVENPEYPRHVRGFLLVCNRGIGWGKIRDEPNDTGSICFSIRTYIFVFISPVGYLNTTWWRCCTSNTNTARHRENNVPETELALLETRFRDF